MKAIDTVVAGWGSTGGGSLSPQDDLREAKAPIYNRDVCQAHWAEVKTKCQFVPKKIEFPRPLRSNPMHFKEGLQRKNLLSFPGLCQIISYSDICRLFMSTKRGEGGFIKNVNEQ